MPEQCSTGIPQPNNLPEGLKQTELGPLPEDWEVMRLGDIANFEAGKRMKGGALENGEVLSLGGEHIDDFGDVNLSTPKFISKEFYDNLSKGKLNIGDVIICKDGAKTGKVAYIKRMHSQYMAINEHIFIIRSKDFQSFCNPFIFFFMFSRLGQSQVREAYHGLIGGITNSDISNFRIPLPPLPEQQKIAQILSTVQRSIEVQDKIISATKELKKSLMRHLFTYGPVPLDQVDKVPLKETEIGPIPEHWEVTTLKNVIAATQYGISLRGNQKGKYPILRMNNLVDGLVDTLDLQYVDLDEDSFQKFKVNQGDILFNRTNSCELVGKTAIFNLEGDFVFASYLVKVVTDTRKLNPDYLNYYLNWEVTQSRLKMLATRGVSQSNINATKLRGFHIPLPLLPEQQQIAQILSAVDTKIEKEEKKKRALKGLFKSLLHNLMTGKIRVNKLEIKV